MINFCEIAQQYETPFYLYNLDQIQEKFLAYKQAFAGRKNLICFALKANSNLSVVAKIAELEGGADCVSIGEIKRAILAGIKPYRIIFSGVGKKDSEIKEALKIGILFINVESFAELKRIEVIAQEMQIEARISIRVNPNIDPKTHPYISTGLSENKFGVDIQEAKQMYLYAHKSLTLKPIGVHFHIGSQLTELDPIIQSTQKIADFARSLVAIGIDLKFFDVGGGIGIRYENEKTIDLYAYAQGILSKLNGLDVTIICEPGRSIVGEAGYLVTRVLYEKHTQNKRFVIIDGAMNDLLRPSLYNAHHNIKIFHEKKQEKTLADVVGPVCESGDFLAKNAMLPPMESGDLIVFENAGAYGFSMSSNYNTRSKCAEIGIEKGEVFILRKPESFDFIVRDELEILNQRKNR
ncbi:diaminopimelate decarboxylase [Helicobacter anatolicus]|uniref:diaminopimelate decarboxylase n=1 Tax=Helicobacter anatolicus TaxID=2905874 RepID=UPI001E4906D9|nr:diaminopimelate decarboxylase [Helicobacter anatolicus]MCE3039967.1 diaminopimelate decarboxylase [Helicobacter anatolicus]